MQYLLSLPQGMASTLSSREAFPFPQWFAACDPAGSKLGSGGGTANLLVEAWRAAGEGISFEAWLEQERRLIVHGGGDSRRLPAYAAVGKPFLPIPALKSAFGQRLDQTLLDLQLPDFRRLLESAPPSLNTLVASGDVLLRFGDFPPIPSQHRVGETGEERPIDVLIFGMRAGSDTAQNFGVVFSPWDRPSELAFFLQKPSPTEIRALVSQDWVALVDTGMWLLSERAIAVLMQRCGWDPVRQLFMKETADPYELYARFGLGLGTHPGTEEDRLDTLQAAVVALPESEFYHLGTSRQLIETVGTLQEQESRRGDRIVSRIYPDQIVQNARLTVPVTADHHTLWIENAHIPAGWTLAHDHLLTNVPENDWHLSLTAGQCLDFPPVDADKLCVRFYGIDDTFVGKLGAGDTLWMGRPASEWFAARGLTWERAGLDTECDIQLAALFPCLDSEDLEGKFVAWLIAAEPSETLTAYEGFAERWRSLPRISAREITARIDLRRLAEQQQRNRHQAMLALYRNRRSSMFHRLDLQVAAEQFAQTDERLPLVTADDAEKKLGSIARMHDHMWRSVVMQRRGHDCWEAEEQAAFACLRHSLLNDLKPQTTLPQRQLLDDQIIWARAPVRLDLAGGWTDTPPYCLEHGGNVVNAAVDLNGQPPIQIFVKMSRQPQIVLRSIDLGVEQKIDDWDGLSDYAHAGGEFSLAKAALVQAGFLPSFYADPEEQNRVSGGQGSLKRQLEAFGGGIEISLLAAVPKGSGLGTSSILAAALLGTLSDLCGLGWDRQSLIRRTLALEQMLTTGGGWQDQAGGIAHGIKRIEAMAGHDQTLTYHWLPDDCFDPRNTQGAILLYYTGLTRMAKRLLQEIVRGMFLNDRDRLEILAAIGANAGFTSEAIQKADYGLLSEAIRRSWRLNCRLDADTNPPAVQSILTEVGDYLEAAKLLGAGGGGYLLMLAKDPVAAGKIRQILTHRPPNDRARFMDFNISHTGLEITRS